MTVRLDCGRVHSIPGLVDQLGSLLEREDLPSPPEELAAALEEDPRGICLWLERAQCLCSTLGPNGEELLDRLLAASRGPGPLRVHLSFEESEDPSDC